MNTKTPVQIKKETQKQEAQGLLAASIGSASVIRAQSRVMAIKEIERLCVEALDHDTSWPLFCKLVQNRLEIETALMPNESSSGKAADGNA